MCGYRAVFLSSFFVKFTCVFLIQVNMSHPIVNEARKNGNTLFVIATLFQAEKCNITVSFSEKISDSAGVTAKGTASGVPVVEAAAGGSIKDSKSSVKGMACYTQHIIML